MRSSSFLVARTISTRPSCPKPRPGAPPGRWSVLLALAGAAGYLIFTDSGRRARARAGSYMRTNYDRLRDYWNSQRDLKRVVEDRVEHDHPDTAMAAAFEEALAGNA